MKNWKLPEFLQTPLGLMTVLGLLIAVSELLIMIVIYDAIAFLHIPDVYWNFIDAILLILFVSPALYFLVFQKIHDNEERFRQINASVQDAIIVVNEQDLITEWNLAAQKMFQYSQEEAIGLQVNQLIFLPCHHADAERDLAGFQKIGVRSLIGKTTEISALRKDGSEFPIELSLSAAKVKGRWHAMGVIRDITERKRAEDELRIAAVAFSTQNGMVITDPEGKILRVNEAFTRLTGYRADEAVGKTMALLHSGRQSQLFYQHMWQKLLDEDQWRGEIWNRRKNGQIYPEMLSITAVVSPERGVTHYVGNFIDITANKEAEARIHRLAYYDPLTSLPNRRLLQDLLGQVLAAGKRSGRYGALIFLDLDNFKPINDTHGHDVGDLLLIEVARRITLCVRDVDTVARLGGDEFVVMLSDLDMDKAASTAEAEAVAEKIRNTVAEPYLLTIQQEDDSETTVEHSCTSSLGVALFISHESSVEEIIKCADMAMYQAKESGGNQIHFFDQTICSAD